MITNEEVDRHAVELVLRLDESPDAEAGCLVAEATERVEVEHGRPGLCALAAALARLAAAAAGRAGAAWIYDFEPMPGGLPPEPAEYEDAWDIVTAAANELAGPLACGSECTPECSCGPPVEIAVNPWAAAEEALPDSDGDRARTHGVVTAVAASAAAHCREQAHRSGQPLVVLLAELVEARRNAEQARVTPIAPDPAACYNASEFAALRIIRACARELTSTDSASSTILDITNQVIARSGMTGLAALVAALGRISAVEMWQRAQTTGGVTTVDALLDEWEQHKLAQHQAETDEA